MVLDTQYAGSQRYGCVYVFRCLDEHALAGIWCAPMRVWRMSDIFNSDASHPPHHNANPHHGWGRRLMVCLFLCSYNKTFDSWSAGSGHSRGGPEGPPPLVAFDPAPTPVLWIATALCLTGHWLNRATVAVRAGIHRCVTASVHTKGTFTAAQSM